MKKEKNKGCIYWDESSRGKNNIRKPGRWVGERLENGKRVRMRSTNYDNVLQWVTGKKRQCNRTPLKGLPEYSIDVERQEVFGRRGQLLTGSFCGKNKLHFYTLHDEGKHLSVSFNRLAYAALHNIDVRKIPANMSVIYKDGEYILMYHDELLQKKSFQHRKEKQREIKSILRKRKHEIEMLQRFYTTGDSAEIVTYVTKDIFNSLVVYVMARYHCQLEKATDIVLDATERFLRRATEGDVPLISISPTIQGLCLRAMKEQSQKREYNDNVRY
jgi:hypothetical protein